MSYCFCIVFWNQGCGNVLNVSIIIKNLARVVTVPLFLLANIEFSFILVNTLVGVFFFLQLTVAGSVALSVPQN